MRNEHIISKQMCTVGTMYSQDMKVYDDAIQRAYNSMREKYTCEFCNTLYCGMASMACGWYMCADIDWFRATHTNDPYQGWKNAIFGCLSRTDFVKNISLGVPLVLLEHLEMVLYILMRNTNYYNVHDVEQIVLMKSISDLMIANPHVPFHVYDLAGEYESFDKFTHAIKTLNTKMETLHEEWIFWGTYESYIAWMPQEMTEDVFNLIVT